MSNRSTFAICLFAALLFLFVFFDCRLNSVITSRTIEKHRTTFQTKDPPNECFSTLGGVAINVPAILIDQSALFELSRNCRKQLNGTLKLAVDEGNFEKLDKNLLNHHEISLFRDDPRKDYWEFLEANQTRIVPRFAVYSIGNIFFPANIPRFLRLWKSGRKLECKNYKINRNGKDKRRNIPLDGIEDIAKFRDSLYHFEMLPFLNGGTLLGWYRECSIIPHTWDIDFAVKAVEFNDQYLSYVKGRPAHFWLRKQIGMRNDSMELNVKTRKYGISIDLFLMYDRAENDTAWVGGTDLFRLTRFRYTYPRIADFCSAELLGHAFLVPCDVEKIIEVEYGSKWRTDHPTRLFSWSSSHKNVQQMGRWSPELRPLVYQIFAESPSTNKIE